MASGCGKFPGLALSLCRKGTDMSDKCYTPVIAGYGNFYTSVLGKPIPNAHPSNCKHECPYGKDRAFCFPCYAKIMSEHRAARKAATEGV